ncbi:Ig-like domain-containing protein [Myxococcus stipitatus]|uniref:Ig-like domain-containing protein n=1 Tax=Myxococcus stipitatus TaxID=83455 RepID=UPI0030CDA38F
MKTLRISPESFTLAMGIGAEVSATATFSDGSTRDVTREAAWSSSDAAIGTVSSDAGGAPQVRALAKGQATLRATYSEVSAQARLDVTDATAVSLALAPKDLSLAAGLTRQLVAMATFSDGTSHVLTTDLTWSSSNEAIASISASGLVRAAAPGEATLKARFGALEATVKVTVSAAVVTSLAVTPSEASMARGATLTLTAMVTRSDGTTVDVSNEATWSSSDASIATVNKRVASGVAQGSVRITATFAGATGGTGLSVSEAVALAVTPASNMLIEGHPRQLHAEATLSNGLTHDVTASAAWTSSTTDVAVVSMTASTQGQVTPVGQGAATITATFNGLSGSGQVSVSKLSVTGVVPTFQMMEDGVVAFTARLTKALPPSTRLRWRVSVIRHNPPADIHLPPTDSPVVGQPVHYFAGTSGEVADKPETWTGGAATDASGAAYVGQETGFELSATGLQGAEGHSYSFRTRFAIKGDYTFNVELLEVGAGGALARIGDAVELGAVVGTMRAADDTELLLFSASPTAGGQTEEESFPQAFAVRPDGTRFRQITQAPTPFVSPRDVHSEVIRSPDRKSVVWVDGRDKFGGVYFQGLLYIADADGGRVRRLTQASSSMCGERMPEFSPDGQWISFMRSCMRDPYPGRDGTEFTFIIRADGTDERRILISGINDMPPPAPIWPLVFSSFSRDSRTLFTVQYAMKGAQLWAFSLEDGSARSIINFSVPGQEMASIVRFPMELPNGDLLYHYRNEDVSSDTWLERIRPDGTGREIVRPVQRGSMGEFLQSLFTLSPDGTKVAYTERDPVTGSNTLMVSNLDGSDAVSMGNPPSYFVRRIFWAR